MDHRSVAATLIAQRVSTLARIASLTTDLEGLAASSAGSNLDDEHDPEGPTVAFERAQYTALLARAQAHVAEVDAALERLSAARYGTCQGCGHPIAEERLAALPAAQLCIACSAQSKPR